MNHTIVNPFAVADAYRDVYSHAILANGGRLLTVSGQVGVAPDGRLAAGFEGQCRQAFANVDAALGAAGMSTADIVRLGFFLVRREDATALTALRRELLPGIRPAITNVLVAGLISPDWLIEIEALAITPSNQAGANR